MARVGAGQAMQLEHLGHDLDLDITIVVVRGSITSMAKRGRPSLNLTPEERIQRRRLQLVASQRKRRAHKRLALQLNKSNVRPEPETEPGALPPRPDEAQLCQYYDAVFLGQDETATLSSGINALTANSKATTRTTRSTTRTTTKTLTRTVANVTLRKSSPDLQAPLAASHHRGSAPLDTTSDTSVVNAPLAAAVGPHSRASLSQTTTPRIAAYAALIRPEGPTSSSIRADDTPAESGRSSTNQAVFNSDHVAYSNVLYSLVPHGFDLDSDDLLGHSATSSNRKPTVKESDNVFLPGRFSTAVNEWIPTNSNEPPYSHRFIKPYHRRPSYPPSQDSGPASSSVEAADLSAPWAGAKQAIPMGFC
ncbi:hypothetical protein BBK36DRAFT_1171158 [Trichoderma citrinoviride]|uniref:Uncharacterized protein n=1 Tax=Trichoderma citrinoviride TaxID=58853 RepID=A0A2T4B2X2_9HYPO|nr:hypothetical protein BBK36DRAFT_1171158 [Trichoderma citrinoviride]PTB63683.1 hypothetical protein BBK36DRAFT_1171158 [Trichoderma citrinoviride]